MTSTTTIPTETTSRSDFSKVKVGSVYSRHSFGKVTGFGRDAYGNPMVQIENSNGESWTISPNIMEAEFSFADQFDSEEKVSRTRAIEILTDNPRTAMTINYNKKPKTNDVGDGILGLINEAIKTGKAPTKKSVRQFAGEQLGGPERTMIGYHVNSYDEHRRLRFNESGKGQRLVDPRTLNWMICDRVKYVVGK
jgi:hypothetical protein